MNTVRKFSLLVGLLIVLLPGTLAFTSLSHPDNNSSVAITPRQLSISGSVVDGNNQPIGNITINISDGVNGGNTITDGNGNYSFSGLNQGTYTITPVVPDNFSADYLFWPVNRAGTVAVDTTAQNFALLLKQGDADQDALPNIWEIQGYDYDRDNVIDVNLPAMGANPLKKDIFVEIDYMTEFCAFGQPGCGPHSHKPKSRAIDFSINTFANAPVSNPDGTTGIVLHVDNGPNSVMNPINGATWNNFSQANQLPHLATLPGSSDEVAGFAIIANSQGNFKAERRRIFHYALFIHDMGRGVPIGVSGVSTGLPGSGFTVSLGQFPNQEGTMLQQAGTFLHELGHNLNLRHGGGDDTGYKPNYFSVMNYSFQMDGLSLNGQSGVFDYSRFGNVPSLDEANLDETVGLNGAPLAYGTTYYCGPNDEKGVLIVSPNGPIDWNCNMANDGSGVSADINKDKSISILTGFDDWSNLVFNGGEIGANKAQAVSSQTTSDELTFDEAKDMETPYEIALDGGGEFLISAGISGTLPMTLTNLGSLFATVTITSTSTAGWFDFSAVPVSVTLPFTDSIVTFPITFTIPGAAVDGDVDFADIEATINQSPRMGDLTLIDLVVGDVLADFDAEPVTIKPGSVVTFTDYSLGNVTSHAWNFGDGITSTQQNPSHTYTDAGLYTVTLTVSDGTHTNVLADPELILVDEKLGLFSDFDAYPLRATVTETVTFIDHSAGDVIDWLWSFGDGSTSTSQNPSHTYAAPGLYPVSLTVTGTTGITDTWAVADLIQVIENKIYVPLILR